MRPYQLCKIDCICDIEDVPAAEWPAHCNKMDSHCYDNDGENHEVVHHISLQVAASSNGSPKLSAGNEDLRVPITSGGCLPYRCGVRRLGIAFGVQSIGYGADDDLAIQLEELDNPLKNEQIIDTL